MLAISKDSAATKAKPRFGTWRDAVIYYGQSEDTLRRRAREGVVVP